MKRLLLLVFSFVGFGCGGPDWLKTIDGREVQYGVAEFETIHGVKVAPNGYMIHQSEVEEVTEKTLELWRDVKSLRIPDVYMSVQPLPFADPLERVDGLYAGLAWPTRDDRSHWIVLVGFNEPFCKTGFSHELAHILAIANDIPDMSHEAGFMREYRCPTAVADF